MFYNQNEYRNRKTVYSLTAIETNKIVKVSVPGLNVVEPAFYVMTLPWNYTNKRLFWISFYVHQLQKKKKRFKV